MSLATLSERKLRILDFDIENRPITYWYEGRPSAEVTAIAWSWVDNPDVIECWQLTKESNSDIIMLLRFLDAYDQADIVTGHYIRAHDLPIVNAHCVVAGLQPLEDKLTSDTRLDLIKFKDISKSQETLGAMFGLEAQKVHMTQHDWREANQLTPNGLKKTHDRVVGDVREHMQLRKVLLERGLLGPPRVWTTATSGKGRYTG